jgi:predicted ATPase
LRTVLSSITNIDYPHAFAAREELRSLRFLHLNPKALREPSSAKAPRSLSREGDNMPTTLARMQAEDKFALTDVSRDMANLVPGILEIKLEQDKLSDKYVIYAETTDQRSFSSQVLSDGTLRLLALATLRNDPQFHGVLCLEEPENGVQPLLLRNMARVLREMATDFNDPQQVDEPLRQVLITTHSPSFISQPEVIDSLLLAIMPVQVQGKNAPSLRVTRMVPVTSSNISGTDINGDKALAAYTIDMVRKYLDSDRLDEARNQLDKVRKTLNER